MTRLIRRHTVASTGLERFVPAAGSGEPRPGTTPIAATALARADGPPATLLGSLAAVRSTVRSGRARVATALVSGLAMLVSLAGGNHDVN